MVNYFSETGELNTKLTGYDEPLTVHTSLYYNQANVDDSDYYTKLYGETLTDNRWNDLYKQFFNIDLQYDWTSLQGDYSQQLRLGMTAGELPDIFTVISEYDLRALQEADLIWDLTDVYNEYATDHLKAKYAEDGDAALARGTIDGRLYGLPDCYNIVDPTSFLWIRDDWMEKLGLEYPTNLEELKGIMDAFMTQDPDGNGVDDTWGLGMTKSMLFYTKGIANAFGADPQMWVEEDGQVIYGGTSEKVKPYLSFLADLYKEGYIDPEFVVYNDAELREQIVSGKVGIYYWTFYSPQSLTSLHEMDPDARLKILRIPYTTGEPVKSHVSPNVGRWLCVNKNFEHPEAAVKILSFDTMVGIGNASTLSDWIIYGQVSTTPPSGIGMYPVGSESTLAAYRFVQKCYESDDPEALGKDVDAKSRAYWKNQFVEDENVRWGNVVVYGPGGSCGYADQEWQAGNILLSSFYGVQTQLFQDNMPSIGSEQEQIFTDIMLGNLSVDDGFQQWLSVFDSLKGNEMTAYANEWAAEMGTITNK